MLQSYRRAGLASTVQFLDRLKEFGFGFATMGGVSIGIEDLEIPAEKQTLLDEAEERVERFQRAYNTGQITFGERYNKVIDAWTHANNDVAEAMVKAMREPKGGFNPVFMMFDSGSRGSRDQIRQLAGMRGLMAKPQKKLTGGIGEIIESPIKSNFREGLTVLEYFISTHGARKGLADTALKTADAGYLTRRLVDVAQDVTITEEDCGTILGLEIAALKEGEDIIEPLSERILGNVAAEDVFDPHELDESATRTLLVQAGQLIDEESRAAIEDAGIEKVRDPLGAHLRGEARGLPDVLRPQPGHDGRWWTWARRSAFWPRSRSASRARSSRCGRSTSAAPRRVSRKQTARQDRRWRDTIEYGDAAGVRCTEPRGTAHRHRGRGRHHHSGEPDENAAVVSRFPVPQARSCMVNDRARRTRRTAWSTPGIRTPTPIISDVDGTMRFVDLVEEESLSEELDEVTGLRPRVVIEDREKKLHPHIEIVQEKGGKEKRLRDFVVPVGAQLIVQDGVEDLGGYHLAKIAARRTRRATSRAVCRAWRSCSRRAGRRIRRRSPRSTAWCGSARSSAASARSSCTADGDGRRRVAVDETQPAQLYEVPAGKHLRVHEGDRVRAGDRLTEGPVNPHDILRIKGPRAVQEYLLNEVQEVYRLQGVRINDKHIGVIVRQMLQKVRVTDPGDTRFLEGETWTSAIFRDENERLEAERRESGHGGAGAARDHQGEPDDAVVHLGGVASRRPRGCSPTPRSAAPRTICWA